MMILTAQFCVSVFEYVLWLRYHVNETNPKVPNVKVPNVKVPNVKVPNVKVPNVKVPNVKVPNVKAPNFDEKSRCRI
jgi:hypothetical protein